MAFAGNAGTFGLRPSGTPTTNPTNPLGGNGTTASAFGSTNQPASGGLFGQPQQSSAPTTGLFGSTQNTNTNTGSSLFGQPQQQNPTGGLFGGSTAQQPSSGGLFGNTQTQQPNQTGSAFGQSQPSQSGSTGGGIFGAQNPPAATAGGGLFGQSSTNTGGGLFGQPGTNATSGTGGGLFGQTQPSTNPSTGPFASAQPATNNTTGTSGLFGNPSTANTGGPFGTTSNQQTTNPPAGGGLFGSSTAQIQTNPSGGGLFGSNTGTGGLFGGSTSQQPNNSLFNQNQQAGGSSLFGGNTANNAGSSLFGPKPAAPLAVSATNQSGTTSFSKSTKFNDLPDNVKKVFEDIESHIQGRLQISTEMKQRKLGEEPTKGQELIRSIYNDLSASTTAVHSDILFTRDLKSKADQAVQDIIVATRIIEGFKNPQQQGAYLKNHASFPLEFFDSVTEQMQSRVQWYKTTIEQIERKLASSASQTQYTPQAIATTIQAQHATFISLASKAAALHAELQKIKVLYTQLWRQKTGSVRDPFNEVDRAGAEGDFGLDGLHVK